MDLFWDRQKKRMEVLEWAAKFEDVEYRILALDYDGERLMVSTIWDGMQSPPSLFITPETARVFETAVLRDGEIVESERYHSEDAAMEGHAEFCMKVLGRPPRPEDGHRETVIERERAAEKRRRDKD